MTNTNICFNILNEIQLFTKLLEYQGGGMSTKPMPYDENLIYHWMEMGICRYAATEIINICLSFAIENYEIGVWGGTSDRQRKHIRKYRPN